MTKQILVTKDLLACAVGSGSVEVFATPMVAALMEGAAAALAQEGLADGITTVGTEITVSHTAPTVEGMTVTAEATLLETDGRTFRFSLRAWDDCGEIATGSHTRASVKTERFLEKAKSRKAPEAAE
jgi:predicted thioesterase